MERRWVTSQSYKAALDVLIEARRELGLSQRDLADRLGKPRSFVSKVENRERRLDIIEFIGWARALGLEASLLIATVEARAGWDLEF